MSGRGLAFVVSGPSGAGKTSLVQRVISQDPGLVFSVSHTTRAPRANERDGEDYRFVSVAEFQRLSAEGAFLEWAEYQGNLYGTSRAAVELPTAKGLDLILEVEIQGARQLKSRLPGAIFVFVMPPSMEALADRLRRRGSDAEDSVRKRLARAEEEVRESTWYQYVVINDDFDRSVADLMHVIGACRIERARVLPLLRERFELD